MFLAYLDSSGGATFRDTEDYVLTSAITNEMNWQSIDNGIRAIKLKHFPNLPDSDVEFHAKDMMSHSGIYNGVSWDKTWPIFNDIFDFMSDVKTDLCFINVLIDKTKLYPGKDIETWAYRLLFERINKFINRQNEKLILANSPPQFGISIIDSCGLRADQRLKNKLYSMLKNGTMYSKLEWLIEDPLFTDSKWRNLSQIADCVAYCVRRHLRKSAKTFKDWYWDTYFSQIERKFDTSDGSYIGYGLKIFP
jgi:hypothetical protein